MLTSFSEKKGMHLVELRYSFYHVYMRNSIFEIRIDGKILVVVIMQRNQRGCLRYLRQQEFRKTFDGFHRRQVARFILLYHIGKNTVARKHPVGIELPGLAAIT